MLLGRRSFAVEGGDDTEAKRLSKVGDHPCRFDTDRDDRPSFRWAWFVL